MSEPLTQYLADALGEYLTSEPGTDPPSEQLLIPQQLAARLEISNELLMDYGVIPDTRPPPKPPSRRDLLRWRWQDTRERLAEHAYRLISGREMPDSEDR